MTGRKMWLKDFDESKKSKFKLADNSSLRAEGTDNIVIQRRNRAKVDSLGKRRLEEELFSNIGVRRWCVAICADFQFLTCSCQIPASVCKFVMLIK